MPTQIEIDKIIASSGNFTSGLQVDGIGVSISGHTHTSSDITNFNSSVSGLIPTNTIFHPFLLGGM